MSGLSSLLRWSFLWWSLFFDRPNTGTLMALPIVPLMGLQMALQIFWFSGFRRNLGCAPCTRSWVFVQNFQKKAFFLLCYSACKKATTMLFMWYCAINFFIQNGLLAIFGYLDISKTVFCLFKKIYNLNFFLLNFYNTRRDVIKSLSRKLASHAY